MAIGGYKLKNAGEQLVKSKKSVMRAGSVGRPDNQTTSK